MAKLSSRTAVVFSVALSACAWFGLCGPVSLALGHGGFQGTGAVMTRASVLLVDLPGPEVSLVSEVAFEQAEPGQSLYWLIPVRGSPVLDASTGTAFARLDASTAPQFWCERLPRDDQGLPCEVPGAEGGTQVEAVDRSRSVGLVRPFFEDSVPFHDLVVLSAPASPPTKAEALDRVEAAGFATVGWDGAILADYFSRGFDVVIGEFRPSTASGRLRALALRYQSDVLEVPNFVGVAGQSAPISLRLWLVGPTHAVPLNLPSVLLNDARLNWLSARPLGARMLPDGGGGPTGEGGYRPDNYDSVVLAAAGEAGGVGLITELAGPASQHRERVWGELDGGPLQGLLVETYEDDLDLVIEALGRYGSWDGIRTAVADHVTLPEGVSLAAFVDGPAAYRGQVEVDAAGFRDALATGVVEPLEAVGTLLQAGPYLTRLYTRFAPQGLEVAPRFDFNYDLAQVEHVRVAQQVTACVGDTDDRYRVTTPQGAVVPGTGDGWPSAMATGPAALKVVQLGASGPGMVLADNRQQVRSALEGLGGEAVRLPVQAPEDGVSIGGGQGLGGPTPAPEPPAAVPSPPTPLAPFSPAAPVASAGEGAPTSAVAPAEGSGGGCHVTSSDLSGGGSALSHLLTWLGLCGLIGWRRRGRGVLLALLVAVVVGCDGGSDGPAVDMAALAPGGGQVAVVPMGGGEDLSPDHARELEHLQQLRDPQTCKECHPGHYSEWSGSMHAYAALDPVFIAMNQRGQRETGGELGDFCVQCHAPMAVFDGLTQDGLNLDELPDRDRGVSCYYCHNTEAIEGDHNGQLRIANDTTMRGPFDDPIESSMHDAVYSPMFDEGEAVASDTCGACHDIVTQAGVRLERTYQEYLTSVFAKVVAGDPRPFESCLSCHMNPRSGVASSVEGSPERQVHEHFWPAVDLATVDFPHREAMRSAVEDCQLGQGISLFTLEVTPPDLFTFQLETGAGHNQPSGSALDRRLWLEFLAYDDEGQLLPGSSGQIADDALEEYPEGDPRHDPNLLMLRDRIFDAQGEPVHMFWEAAPSEAYPDGYLSQTLPPAKTTYLRGQNTIVKQYRVQTPDGRLPARVTARIRLRPIGRDVLQDLVDSGDLAEAVRDAMQTLTLSKTIEWNRADGASSVVQPADESHDCTSYLCLLHPDSPDCR